MVRKEASLLAVGAFDPALRRDEMRGGSWRQFAV